MAGLVGTVVIHMSPTMTPRLSSRRWPGYLGLVAIAAAALAAGVLDYSAPGVAPAQAGPLGATDSTIADVTEHALPSVVNVFTTVEMPSSPYYSDPFFNSPNSPFHGNRGRRATSLGSGVIVSSDGLVLTNNHVIDHASEIKVTLADGRDFAAKVIGADPKSDVAVIKLQGHTGKLKPIPIGNSNKVRLGEIVLAIGDPFGVGQAVTMGIVSAKGRGNMGIEDYEDFIQTDAAINPGNSGGALINTRGELIGINTAILSRSGGYQGIGFAIPTSMAVPIMRSLITDGKVSRGWLGVAIHTVDSSLAARAKLPVRRGVYVAQVEPGGPGGRQGLQAGDVIVAVDGHQMNDMSQLRNTIAMAGAGKVVALDVVRGHGKKTLRVKLGELPERPN